MQTLPLKGKRSYGKIASLPPEVRNAVDNMISLPNDDPERAAHMDSALRVACFIPTEVLYTASQTAEVLRSLADKGAKGAISDVGVGLELCRAAMRAARLNILINAAGMEDEVFAMTLRRECELVFEQYGPIIDAGLAAVEARIG